ncbi:MAG: hypothetical protein Q9187_004576 [Circinaria calcarea]
MSKELAKIETRLNKEFRKRNDLAKDEKWKAMETHEQKVEMDATRYLKEQFLSQESKTFSLGDNGVVVLKTWDDSEIHAAADDLDLCHESVDAPTGADGSQPSVKTWIVIGKDESPVYRKIQEIRRKAVRARQRVEDARIERMRKVSDDLAAEVKKSGSKAAWDVTGSWAIKCPYIEEQYGHHGYEHYEKRSEECSLDMHFSQNSEGKHMWAELDFIIYIGVFRFVDLASAGPRSNNPHQLLNLGYIQEHRYHLNDRDKMMRMTRMKTNRKVTRMMMIVMAVELQRRKNSSSRPTLNPPRAVQNGVIVGVVGEGEIALYSDEKLCSITFGGSGGTKLFGIFESSLTPRIEFTGLKIGNGATGTRKDIDSEWRSRDEKAHERARVGRWH